IHAGNRRGPPGFRGFPPWACNNHATSRRRVVARLMLWPPPMSAGTSAPLGATVNADGINFSVFSKRATAIDLLLFDRADDTRPSRVVAFDPRVDRSYHYWHHFVPGLTAGQIYAFRVHGPYDPARGHRFDPDKVLLDPYGRAVVVPSDYDRKMTAMKSVAVDSAAYDWEGNRPRERPAAQRIVYQMH